MRRILQKPLNGINAYISFEKEHKAAPAFQKIIDKKTAQKIASSSNYNAKTPTSSVLAPNVELGFNTIGYTGHTPPDNTMAISEGGLIVTAVNSNLQYYDTLGNLLYSAAFDDFINDTSITSLLYDPLIQYDRGSDRFVMTVILGFQSSMSKVVMCFSKTNNPLNGWWVYYLTGNPMGDSSWFDFPKMGISNDEIFVTGNLFTDNYEINQSVIYQIDKQRGYQGDTLAWAYWHNLSGNPFTIVPASYGQNGNYGPGLYFISTYSFDDTTTMIPYLRLYDITGNLNDSTSINYHSTILPFGLCGNAMQLGTNYLLSNGDPRGQDAFYLDGKIHFVYASEYANGFSGINYNRLSLSTMTNWNTIYGVSGFDCNYPSLASSGNSITDNSVYISYLKSGTTIYPEVRIISCDDIGQWSASSLMKAGETFVSFIPNSNNVCRWGDYSDICLRYNSAQTEIWANGCYGKIKNSPTNTYRYLNSWISKVNGLAVGVPNTTSDPPINAKVFPNPSTDMFKVEFTNASNQQIWISLTDMSGKQIKLLYNDISKKGKNLFTFNQQALSKGIYFLIIENDTERIAVKKIIVQ